MERTSHSFSKARVPTPDDTLLYGFQYWCDEVGNRIRLNRHRRSSGLRPRQQEVSRVAAISGPRYLLDAEVAEPTPHACAWNQENLMIDATVPGVATENEFTWNAAQQRATKTDSEGTVSFLRDGQKIVAERDPSDGLTARYANEGASLYGPLLMDFRDSAAHYPSFDMLGTVQNLTDATATISDKNLFEAFGVKRGATGTTATPFGYVGGLGYYHDQDLSMPLLSIRHYQPRTGLFVSGDPDHRLPSYQLVAQLPTSFTDPSGMSSWGGGGEWVLLIGGGIRTLWCEDGGKRCLHWFLKVCIGGSAGVDAGYTANVNDCAEYEGWFLEGGAGWPTSLVGAVAPWSWPPWKWPLEAGIGLGAPASLAGCCYVDLNKCTPLTLGSVTTRFDNVCLGGAIGSLLQLTVGRFADEFDRWIQGQMDSWQSGWGMPYQ